MSVLSASCVILDALRSIRRQLFVLGKWLVMGTITGSVVGFVGTAFAKCLLWANQFRAVHPEVLFFLPVFGGLIVFLYQVFRNTDDTGTNMVIASLRSSSGISYQMAPLIFASTVLTQLGGGSAGREGAALQIGGGLTNLLSSIPFLRFTEQDRKTNVMCGMSAGFAALFGTPLAAAVFSMEVVRVGIMNYAAMVPCVISAFTARYIAAHFGVEAEAFAVGFIPAPTPVGIFKFLVLGAVLAVISILFCAVLHGCERGYRRVFPNPYLRIAAAGCIIIGLRYLVGTDIYLGAGTGLIAEILESGNAAPVYAFLLKMAFTGLTLGAGFKGGEIVPSFCIGAAFGSCAAGLMGMPVGLVTACGMVGLFCGVTNCPMSALLIAFEMFGFSGMHYYLITIAVSYMLSGRGGLYRTQEILEGKY